MPSRDMAPRDVFQNNPRAPNTASQHDHKAVPQRPSELRRCYYPRPRTTSGLGYGGETTPHQFIPRLRLTRLDDWRHPMFYKPL